MAYTTTTYCTEDQVEQVLGVAFRLSATSNPSTTQAAQFMSAVAAEINTALASNGITVPVTTPAYFLDDVTRLNALGAAAMILQAAFPAREGPGSSTLAASLMLQYRTALKAYRSGEGIPEDSLPSSRALENYFTNANAIGADDVEDAFGAIVDANPIFSMGERF